MMRRLVMARPTGVSCSQKTQFTIRTANMGTQCAIRFLSSAGTQTDALLPESEAGAFSGEFTASQDDADSVVPSPSKQPGNHITSYSSYYGDAWNATDEHGRIQTEREIYVGEFVQQSNDQETSLAALEDQSVGMRPHTCCVCDKKFRRRDILLVHLRVHTGERPYVCVFCQRSFAQKTNLVNHEKLHTGEKPYTCSVCQKGFSRRGDLVYHERLHSGDRPYVCSYCQKSFNRSDSLTKHQRSHTGEKPYTCSVCQRSFSQRANLRTHEKLHK